jgi:hypothetical protein
MDQIVARHNNFIIYIGDIFKKINKPIPPDAQELLAKPALEFVATIKVLLKQQYNIDTIESLILTTLSINRNDIIDKCGSECYNKLRRYGEYFIQVAQVC